MNWPVIFAVAYFAIGFITALIAFLFVTSTSEQAPDLVDGTAYFLLGILVVLLWWIVWFAWAGYIVGRSVHRSRETTGF